MQLLVIGGAGHVGRVLRPALEARHTCRYLDLTAVPDAADSRVGSLNDDAVLGSAMEDVEVCLQLAMMRFRGPGDQVDDAYDVHVKGMHRILHHARQAGARRVVYASTLSVYRTSRPPRDNPTESAPPDAVDLYGLTKRLGDVVCQAFCQQHPASSVISLQMVGPRNAEQWARMQAEGQDLDYATGPSDLRDAWLRAIELPQHQGYDAVFICGDRSGRHLSVAKAQQLLGWVPQGR
ncbi:MAG: NAD(P)-dependent oxidoreductase [Fimbriimonadaceae bacterium]|nr:NAD(P)-dependent oxidoreductase [Fimbriimonadaceae bacterium]